jgi:KaiC/GvpD/RAD55 family RecA-like ATPase
VDDYPGPSTRLRTRPRTVQRLAELLDEYKIVHVRGTPVTGKTTLAALLYEFLTEKQEKVIFIDK